MDSSETVSLQFPGGTADFPVIPSIEGASSIDFSSLTKQTRVYLAGSWFCEHRFNEKAPLRTSMARKESFGIGVTRLMMSRRIPPSLRLRGY